MANPPPGKSTAVIAYITIAGWFIAWSMNKDKPEVFATWHIKNMFGLCLMFLIAVVTQYQIHLLVGDVLYITTVLLWLFSLIMAIRDKKMGVPVLSAKFQEWFTFLGTSK
ncbi:MAG: hypothetical protein R3359_10260 [Marinirhabdus sp.]|nr:hypothetical protein [Marinirhabdus sp.]